MNGNMIGKLNYKKVEAYWNNVEEEFINQYSLNYKIPEKKIALYRFKKEKAFLEKNAVFKGSYLDLGCGTGNFIYAWRNKFKYLIGIDISNLLLKFAKKICDSSHNIKFAKDNIANFEKHTKKINDFSFIYIGGTLIYLNDEDVRKILESLGKKLAADGIIIFRVPTARNRRIVSSNGDYNVIRRTVDEYEKLTPEEFSVKKYTNYSYNYATLIGLYWNFFPFLRNKIKFFENPVIEFLFLFIPLNLFSFLKKNMIFDVFFVLKK